MSLEKSVPFASAAPALPVSGETVDSQSRAALETLERTDSLPTIKLELTRLARLLNTYTSPSRGSLNARETLGFIEEAEKLLAVDSLQRVSPEQLKSVLDKITPTLKLQQKIGLVIRGEYFALIDLFYEDSTLDSMIYSLGRLKSFGYHFVESSVEEVKSLIEAIKLDQDTGNILTLEDSINSIPIPALRDRVKAMTSSHSASPSVFQTFNQRQQRLS